MEFKMYPANPFNPNGLLKHDSSQLIDTGLIIFWSNIVFVFLPHSCLLTLSKIKD